MNDHLRNLTGLDRVIHEPGRLIIVALLFAVEEADFRYLLTETGMNKGTLSSHLARLEAERYVDIEKTYRGKIPLTILRLTESGRRAFQDYRVKLKGAL